MPQVQVIQPIQQQPKRLRVAAYARVSSDSEDQLNSLAVQVDYYTHLIQENPNWEFAGIYTDEGITGTSTKRREQFNRLMDDCRAGLIDRVLVKSASRFARNTADALSSVRELKSLGVTVAFEKEGFDTETSNGEMLLSIICAVAQEESLSISQNMKWGIHKRMRTGNYITNATPFGYTQINHQLVPEKNNAMIVNDIFKSYLSGMSINEIAEHLNTIYPKENSKWNPRTIHAILRNEKYIGDSLYQKTYTTDSLPLKRYLNTGQRSKYYAMETHEGIISKTDYEKVQNLLAKKCSVRCRLKSPAAIVSRQLTNANDTKAAITANMPYPNDWSAETAAALISGLLGTSTAENKSFGDASIDSNTEQNFAVIHRQSRKKNCIRLF